MERISIDPKRFEQLMEKAPDGWKTNKFTMVPNIVLFDTRLTIAAKVVFAIIQSHTFGKDCAYPSLQKIAQEAGCAKNTVIKAIRKLEEIGYLIVDRKREARKKNRANRYYPKKLIIQNRKFKN